MAGAAGSALGWPERSGAGCSAHHGSLRGVQPHFGLTRTARFCHGGFSPSERFGYRAEGRSCNSRRFPFSLQVRAEKPLFSSNPELDNLVRPAVPAAALSPSRPSRSHRQLPQAPSAVRGGGEPAAGPGRPAARAGPGRAGEEAGKPPARGFKELDF